MNLFCNIIKLVILNWQCLIRSQVNLFHVYRQNAFQVVAVDGICSGIIQCLSAEDCIDWLQAIAINISNLTKHNVSIFLYHISHIYLIPILISASQAKCWILCASTLLKASLEKSTQPTQILWKFIAKQILSSQSILWLLISLPFSQFQTRAENKTRSKFASLFCSHRRLSLLVKYNITWDRFLDLFPLHCTFRIME